MDGGGLGVGVVVVFNGFGEVEVVVVELCEGVGVLFVLGEVGCFVVGDGDVGSACEGGHGWFS